MPDTNKDEASFDMLTFQIIGAVFLTLFLAAAVTGKSTQER